MTFFEAFFAMSEHVCHFGTHENDSFALSEHFPFRNNFFCHVGTFFHFGTQLFAISEHGLFRNGNHLALFNQINTIKQITKHLLVPNH